VNPSLIADLSFDTAKDLAPVMLVGTAPMAIATHPSKPYKSFDDVIKAAKAKPDTISYGSIGSGSLGHLTMTLLQESGGFKVVHIPYKGGGPAVIELLAGQTSLMFANMPTVIQYVRGGKLRALAATGSRRSSAAPDIPTVAESGIPGFEVTVWYGVSAPAMTPRAIVNRLNSEIVRALNSPDLRERLKSQGAEPVGNTPEQYTAFIQDEIAKWAKVIQAAGIKGE